MILFVWFFALISILIDFYSLLLAFLILFHRVIGLSAL